MEDKERVHLGDVLKEMYELERVQGKTVKQVLVSQEAYDNAHVKSFGGPNRKIPAPLVVNKDIKGTDFKIETYG